MAQERRAFDYQLEVLKAELTHIDGAIRQHDEITKSVKNWAILTWTGSLGLALKDQNLHSFVWLTAVIPMVFWIVDASFRRIQRSFIRRIEDIAKFVNSEKFRLSAETGTPNDFELLLMRHKSTKFKDTLLGAMLFRSVWFLYVGLAICSLIVWLMVR